MTKHEMQSIVTVRPAVEADKEFARGVHHRAYHDVVVRQFGKWDEREQDAYFENTWAKHDSEIILYDAQPAGYWSAERALSEIHLHQFLLLPEYQGKKIGSRLLDRLADMAAETGLPVRLQVFRESDALKLYVRTGFKVVGETSDHVLMEYAPSK